MPRYEATFIHTKAVTRSSCCLLPRSEDVSEELTEEESRTTGRAQRTALEDMLRKDQILTKNLKDMVVLAREGRGGEDWVQRYTMLTEMLLRHLTSQLWQAAFRKNPRKARSYAYEKIKVILEEQELKHGRRKG